MKRKGFVFTVDATIAAFTVLTIITFAITQLGVSEIGEWSKYRMLSTGYDITNMLYNTGTLQTLDKNLIEETVNVTLPGNYEMRLEIESYEKIDGTLIQTDTIDVGPEVGDSLLITHGVETFLVFSQQEVDTYNVVEFWIWLK